eukprot:3821821-Rhodomonas_salina.7
MSLQGNLKWNGLPENYHNDPFGENPAEQTSPDPWGSQNSEASVCLLGVRAVVSDGRCVPEGM